MKLNAYAKVNMILNVLGTLPNGYHEVEMLMQAISLCDVVTVEYCGPEASQCCGPQDFEYGTSDLAYRAALLMAETFRPELIYSAVDTDGLELAAGIRGVRISIEKHIPAAAGLAGGSSDAAAVMVGLARLWNTENAAAADMADRLMSVLLPLGASLGSDVPFCIGALLGHPAAIARGTGTELEFVEPVDCAVSLYLSERTLPNKTSAVYRELRVEDCRPRYDIKAFLAAKTVEEKRALMGNHLQPAAERLFDHAGSDPFTHPASGPKPGLRPADAANIPQSGIRPMLCGAGPTYFTIGETGEFRTII